MKTILEELPKMLGTKFGDDNVIYKDGRIYSIPHMTMLTRDGNKVIFSGNGDILIIWSKWDGKRATLWNNVLGVIELKHVCYTTKAKHNKTA